MVGGDDIGRPCAEEAIEGGIVVEEEFIEEVEEAEVRKSVGTEKAGVGQLED